MKLFLLIALSMCFRTQAQTSLELRDSARAMVFQSLNKHFPVIDPRHRTFRCCNDSYDNRPELGQVAKSQMSLIEPYQDAKFYGIGRVPVGNATWYLLAYPHPYGWTEVVIHVMDDSGDFYTSQYLTSGMFDGGEESRFWGWIADVDEDGQLDVITRQHAYYMEPDADEAEVDEIGSCEVYTFKNGSFEMMELDDKTQFFLNATYIME